MSNIETERQANEVDAGPAGLAALDRALFEANPDLVWELAPDGTVRRANAQLGPVLGYSADEVCGRPAVELAAPESRADAERALAAALDGRAGAGEFVMRHRDGHPVYMRAAVMPLAVGGRVVGVFVTSQDVTAAHEGAQRLEEGERLYRSLVEQTPECVSIYDADGRCEFINAAGAAMRGPGYAPADVEGHHWTSFVHPDDRRAYAAALDELAHAPAGATRHLDHRFLWPDGRQVEVEGTAIAVRLHGRPAVELLARDVTARRRADGERLRAQRMEALGRLAAGVAHDFNNLLAVMLIAVESAAAAVPEDDPLREDLADAADAARRGRALTRQLLTFARRQEATPTTFPLNEVIESMGDLLRRIAGPQVRFTLALGPEAGAVHADPGQVEQALLNLVTNARDALPAGGAVAVETGRRDGEVELTVRDTGAGIPPEVRPHLFEPFFTTKPEGNGLGLATVYGVVTGAGGRVEVESAPGEGTAFRLYFPRAEPA
jgi:PAS domain S-box-containing protein